MSIFAPDADRGPDRSMPANPKLLIILLQMLFLSVASAAAHSARLSVPLGLEFLLAETNCCRLTACRSIC